MTRCSPRFRGLHLGLLAILALANPAVGQVFVDAAGTCAGLTPCFTTIQQGVDNASDVQSMVVVFPGTYAESVNLSLMGSAVARPGGDILILNYAIYANLFPPPAMAPQAGTATGGPLADLAAEMAAAHQRAIDEFVAATGGVYQPPADDPNAAMSLPPVNIVPAAGPAVFHTGSFPPNSMNSGDVLLYGLTVKSKDSAGINLPNVTGDIGLVAVHTDDNALDGAFLRAASDISMAGVTAHRNGGDGVDGVAAMGECLLFNASAGGNKANGIVLTCHDTVDVFSLSLGDSPLLPLGEFPDSQFNGNTLVGLAATSTDGSVVLSNSLLLTGSDGPPVQANDNKALGLDLDGDEGVTLVGVRADRNASGIAVQSADSVVAIAVSANDNKTGTGFSAVTTTAGIDFPFPAVGLLVVSATASGNAALGFDLTDTMGNIAVLNSAAVKNQNDGVRLSPKPGGTSFVEGSVLCENTTGGLRQTVNASVAAEGNWWGSVTGPTHPGNPGGTGNAVIDGSNGGSGTVDFLPFIDTITPLVPSDASLKQATEVAFQFSGGNGTVFLGLPPLFFLFGGFIPPDPPFALTTDNGVLIDEDESAATVHTTVNAPQGVLRVRLKASALGPATLTLDGPCGLDAVATLTIGRLNGAPVLSLGALVALAALLALAGGRRLSRR